MPGDDLRTTGDSTIRILAWRLLPFLFLLYVVAYLDRINVGFAALQMRQDLGFSDTVYGLGAGIFFAGYFLFQVPSNLALRHIGARLWIALLMILWGCISSSMMFVSTPKTFYFLRFALGSAEAGFFPGVIFYLRSWFPARFRARTVAAFMTAGPVSGIIGGPISGALLGLQHRGGLAGWQWLFLIEGLPAIVLGFVAYLFLADRPEEAVWLGPEQRSWLITRLREDESAVSDIAANDTWSVFASYRIWLLAFVYFGLSTCAYGIGLWIPSVLRRISGVSNLALGGLSTVPYIAAAVTMVLIALHSDRTGERRWHVAIPAFCGTGALVFAGYYAGYSGSVVPILAAFTIAMAALFSMNGPFWAMPSNFVSGPAAAVGIALINSVGNLGGGFGPYWIGHLRDATGSFKAGLFSIAGILAAAAVVVLGIRSSPISTPHNEQEVRPPTN